MSPDGNVPTRIEVRSVVVEQASATMYQFGNFGYLFLENTNVLGLVIMIPAIVSSSNGSSFVTSIVPSGVEGTSTISNPHTAALAGFVPWALSGTITLVRFKSPRLMWYCLINIRPVNSPWAPANGFSVNSARPEISDRA